MRQENYRNKMKINQMTTALLGIFFYILLVLVLKTIQNWISVGSTGMKIFNIIEFAGAAVYLILYTWGNFKNATQESGKTFGKYLLLIMIPLIIMTIITVILTYAGVSDGFSSKWNAVTFIISPTVFCYIPFGILYQLMSSLPVVVFFIICLILMVLFQLLGFVLGSGSRKFSRERELVRAEQDRRMMQRQDEMARQAVQIRQNAMRQEAVVRRRTTQIDMNDPLSDIENMPVVETEAFTTITDEMIEEAIRLKKIKSAQQKTAARAEMARQQSTAERTSQPIRRTTREESQPRSVQQQSSQLNYRNKDQYQSTQNLQKELEILRKRLEQEEKNKK